MFDCFGSEGISSLDYFVAIVGVVVPLMTIAGSAAAFIWKAYIDAASARKTEFFVLMDKIDTPGTIASKVAAVYQLRSFPEHKEFIIRFRDAQKENIEGSGAEILAAEMDKTQAFFSK